MSPPLPLPDDPSMLEGSCRWRVEAATRSSGLSVTGGFSCPDVGGFGCSETSNIAVLSWMEHSNRSGETSREYLEERSH
jgi:hypothetical protein